MQPGRATRRALPSAVVAALAVLLVLGGVPTTAAQATAPPYLALGDSITFGYVADPPARDGLDPYADASTFVGYPAEVGRALGLDPVNAACPGETTDSMLTLGAADAGCAGYRSAHPLHVEYPGLSQLEFADAFLRANTGTRLVTIAIGINDVLLDVTRCGGVAQRACLARTLPSTLTAVRANLTVIVRTLRATEYTGPIVLLNYYALEYANSAATDVIGALNATIAQVGTDDHLPVADSFDAFRVAAAATQGDGCAAGLFGPGPSTFGPCDLHPDAAGQHVLAAAVEAIAHAPPAPTRDQVTEAHGVSKASVTAGPA